MRGSPVGSPSRQPSTSTSSTPSGIFSFFTMCWLSSVPSSPVAMNRTGSRPNSRASNGRSGSRCSNKSNSRPATPVFEPIRELSRENLRKLDKSTSPNNFEVVDNNNVVRGTPFADIFGLAKVYKSSSQGSTTLNDETSSDVSTLG